MLVSLGANAEHGKRREEGDFRKAYGIACHYNLVKPTDSDAVAKLLRCSIRWAEKLTKDARGLEQMEREAAALAASAEGLSNRKIAQDLGVSPRTVDRIVAASNANSAEMTQAAEEPARDPDDDGFADARVTFSPTGQRWHRALEALRGINAQADVSTMFADRYTRVDHAVTAQ